MRSVIIGKNKISLPADRLAFGNIDSMTTGIAKSITVYSQNANGQNVNVLENKAVAIAIETGSGMITGSGTITAGSSSVSISVTFTLAIGYIGASLNASTDYFTTGISNTFNLLPAAPLIQSRNPSKNFVTIVVSSAAPMVIFGLLGSTISVDEGLLASTNPSSLPTANYLFSSASEFDGKKVLYHGTPATSIQIAKLARITTYTFAMYSYISNGTNYEWQLSEATITMTTK